MGRTDNLTTFMYQFSINSESLNLLEPSEPFRACNGIPPRWWLHLIVVRGFEYARDPESYTNGSVALAGSPLLDRSKGRRQTKRDTKI
jgi:hypothetical protein